LNLEPAVIKSIRENRRAVALYRGLAAIPLLAVIALCVGLAIWQSSIRSPLDQISRDMPDLLGGGASSMFVVTLGIRFVPMIVMFFVALRRLMIPVQRQFADLTKRAERFDAARLQPLMASLEGVSIGLGVPQPELAVLELETPNAIAFSERGRKYVGVTAALLSAEISQNERDAVMAHELAHIVDGDYLKQPTIWRGANGLLFMLAPLVVLLTGLIRNPASSLSLAMIFAPIVIMYIGYPLAIWMTARQYRDFRAARYHNDILADSVAIKVTDNPGAMRTVIQKLRDGMLAAPVMPSETIGFTHMFVGPLKRWPVVRDQLMPSTASLLNNRGDIRYDNAVTPAYVFANSSNRFVRALGTPLETLGASPAERRAAEEHLLPDGNPAATNVQYGAAQAMLKQMDPYIAWENKLVSERLVNVDLIEENRWQAFEVRAGRVITAPGRWE
jgi:Zn-dependent protease with chaperone function